MFALFNLIKSLFGRIARLQGDWTKWIDARLVWMFGVLGAMIMTPVNWVLDRLTGVVEFITERIEYATTVIERLGFQDVPQYWNTFSEYFGYLNLFIPMTLLTFSIGGLLALWLVITVIRLLLRIFHPGG